MNCFGLISLLLFVFTVNANGNRLYFKSKCPKVEPMKNFTIDKLLGRWHLKMNYYSDDSILYESCFKNDHSLQDENTLRMDIEEISANGNIDKYPQFRTIDKNRPGVFLSQTERTLYGIFGNKYTKNVTTESIVLYIDQELQLRYACTQLDHYWYSEADYNYYISVRNRSFDSFSKLVPLFSRIKSIPEDLNKLQFLKNDLTCPN